MDRRDAAGEVLEASSGDHKAGLLNHPSKLLLAGELLNTLHQVLVAVAVAGHQLPDHGDGGEAPLLVHGVEETVVHLAEFHARKHTTGLQDSESLHESGLLVGEIPNPKDNRVQVDGVIGNAGHMFCVALHERQSVRIVVWRLDAPLLALRQHLGINVRDRHPGLPVVVDVGRVVQHAKRDIARPAGDIQDIPPSTGRVGFTRW